MIEIVAIVVGCLVTAIGTLILDNLAQIKVGVDEAKDAARRAHARLDEHENRQSDSKSELEREIGALRGNYKDRFTEVNFNIAGVKQEVLSEINKLKIALAASVVKFDVNNK